MFICTSFLPVVDPEPGKHICLPTVIPMTTEGITLHPYDKFFVNITNFLGTVSLSFSGYTRFLSESCVCEEVGGRFIVVDTGELLHNDVPSNLTDVYLNITIEASEFSAKYCKLFSQCSRSIFSTYSLGSRPSLLECTKN